VQEVRFATPEQIAEVATAEKILRYFTEAAEKQDSGG
jgi:hypothetical protein